RTARCSGQTRSGDTRPGRSFVALLTAGLGFIVELLGLARWAPLVGNCYQINFEDLLALRDTQSLTCLDGAGRFGMVPIDIDLAAFDGSCGQTARLEKASGPEPFVDANTRFFSEICLACHSCGCRLC